MITNNHIVEFIVQYEDETRPEEQRRILDQMISRISLEGFEFSEKKRKTIQKKILPLIQKYQKTYSEKFQYALVEAIEDLLWDAEERILSSYLIMLCNGSLSFEVRAYSIEEAMNIAKNSPLTEWKINEDIQTTVLKKTPDNIWKTIQSSEGM